MAFVSQLEGTFTKMYKSVPHLPVAGQKWLGVNAWWIVLIGVILGAISVIVEISAIIGIATLASTYAAWGVYTAANYNPTWPIIAGVVLVLVEAVVVVLEGLAIAPLKARKVQGWNVLFLLFLVSIVMAVVQLLTLNVFGFIAGLIGAAIGGYFLFEIRTQFSGATVTRARK